MDGKTRRLIECYHPELALSTEEKRRRLNITNDLYFIFHGFIKFFMILCAIFVLLVSTKFQGVSQFWIVFSGLMLMIPVSMILAYDLGNNAMRKMFENISEEI